MENKPPPFYFHSLTGKVEMRQHVEKDDLENVDENKIGYDDYRLRNPHLRQSLSKL